MALSANTVVEVRAAGNDTNGGAFVTGAAGTDYSLQDSKNTGANDKSTTDAVAVGTTTITSATANFQTTIVGNIVYFQGGTGTITAQWRQVTARASTTSITIDAAIAASTGMTMNIGGALVSPGMASGIGLISGNIIYIKAGTYLITNLTPGSSAGNISSSLVFLHIEGYQTTRGDFGTKPTLQASGLTTAGSTLVALTGSDCSIYNIEVDADNTSNLACINLRGIAYRVIVLNGNRATLSGFGASTALTCVRCEAHDCAQIAPFNDATCYWCLSRDNSVTGFQWTGGGRAIGCVSINNTGSTSDGFNIGAQGYFINCISYNNGRAGFRVEDDVAGVFNCIAEANVTGFDFQSRISIVGTNLFTFGNTNASANTAGKAVIFQNTALSGSPFVDASTSNFTLNNTAGAGASCRAGGFPGTIVIDNIDNIGYLDAGVFQHADPVSSGGIGAQIFGS